MEIKEKINLKRLNSVIKKNIIKIIAILFLFTLCGCFYSYKMVTPKYKSTSTILLASNKSNKENASVTQTEVTLNTNLISTYGKILKSTNILEQVINSLSLDMTKENLYKNIQIKEVENTQIIQIDVINKDATKAQEIATELNNVFIDEIKQIYKMDNIKIVDQASLETEPYNINHIRDIVIFFVAGIIFSVCIISIIFFFDTTLKIEQDIEEFADLNVIGSIPKSKGKNNKELLVQENSKSVISEALKTIRTNISFAQSTEGSKAILFTSCNSGEGKSWISSNIAVAYAQSNQNVIIVDADMRKGRQHNIFNVKNINGLSECLKNLKNQNFEILEKYIQETQIPKVHIMPIGAIPPNPSELLMSNNMTVLVDMLKSIYDIIIIDGTPCNLVSDSIPITRIVDTTILVTESRKTKIEDLSNVIKSIRNANGKILGAILNKKEIKGKQYGKGYYYGKMDLDSKIEIKSHTVKELIENRHTPIIEDVSVSKLNLDTTESSEKIDYMNEIAYVTDQINNVKQNLNNYADNSNKILETYTKTVEEIKNMYQGELDKSKLAEEIKQNIIKEELSEKIEQLNYKNEISNVVNTVENVNNLLVDYLDKSNEALINYFDKSNATLEKSEVLNNIVKELQNLNNSNTQDEKTEEIINELRKINQKYDMLAEKINENSIVIKKFESAQQSNFIPKTSNKNNVIEIGDLRQKRNKEEIVIEVGGEIEYEDLVDLAVGVYEINPY